LETRTGLEIAQIHLSKEQSRSSRADDSPTNPVGNRNGRVSMYPASPVRINGSDLYIWNQATGKLVSSFRIETKLVPSIQTSSDHELAAIPVGKEFSKLRPRVEIYDTTTGRRLQVLEMSQPLSGVPMAFSSDGNQLAVITGDRNITIWDPSTGTKLFSFPAAGNTGTSVKGISFSPDGRRLVSVSSDSDVWLWDAKSGKSLISLRNSSGSYWVRDATVSTDDYRPLSDAIDVTDETAAKGAKQLSIAFSSDGRFITLTTVMPDPKGAKIRIETWDGSPRQKR
jgi:WD40 repeat protein